MAIRRQRRRLVCSSVPKQLSSDSTLISLFLPSCSRRRLSSVYPFRWTTDASTVCSEDAGRERRSGIIFDSFVSCRQGRHSGTAAFTYWMAGSKDASDTRINRARCQRRSLSPHRQKGTSSSSPLAENISYRSVRSV